MGKPIRLHQRDQDELRAVLEHDIGADVQPDLSYAAPLCRRECPSHDGKRCRVLGNTPGPVCEPAAEAITLAWLRR